MGLQGPIRWSAIRRINSIESIETPEMSVEASSPAVGDRAVSAGGPTREAHKNLITKI